MEHGIPIILSGPSGIGKSTIIKHLRQELPNVTFSVSHTTRPVRPGEQNGIDYFFVSEKNFEKKIDGGEFMEWANVHGNYYGTTFDSINQTRNMGNHIFIELDVQGVNTLRKIKFDGIYIMILPPSLEELRNRLKKRSTESDEIIEKRLEVGKQEITQYQIYDYIVTNRDVKESVNAILEIIRTEKRRSSRFIPTADDIAKILPSRKDKI